MRTSSLEKARIIAEKFKELPPDEIDRINQANVDSALEQHQEFKSEFARGHCYICGHPITSFSKKRPCLHWFLRPKGLKKNDLVAVAELFGFFRIQTYLRWVANTNSFAKHINDLPDEGSGTKIIELTIRHQNLEWSFSCGESDFQGHQTSQHAKHPHYHLQMYADNRPLIKFSDFHLPFTEEDIIGIETKRQLPGIVKHKFPGGEGMSEVLNDQTLEALVADGRSTDSEDDAALHLDTILIADEGTTISGEDIYKILQEAKAKGVTVASLMHKLPIKNASTQVFVTPGPAVVEQALRTGRKKPV
jgi:hypothetical protein